VAIKANTGGAVARAEIDLGDAGKLSDQTLSGAVTWKMTGGNKLVIGNDPQWLKALADPRYWAVIERRAPRPLIDLIEQFDSAMGSKVREAWTTGRQKQWGGEPPPGYANPDFAGKAVWLSNSIGVIGAYNAQNFNGVSDKFKTLFERPFPPVCSSVLLGNPAANKLLWKFVYAGTYDHDSDLPLYRLQSADGAWFLATAFVEEQPPHHTLVLLKPSEILLESPERDSSSWLLRPADPLGVYGEPYKGRWLLQNWITRHYIGNTALWAFDNQPQTFNWRFCLDEGAVDLNSLTPKVAASYGDLKLCCWTIK
jgi:hypothetical protein